MTIRRYRKQILFILDLFIIFSVTSVLVLLFPPEGARSGGLAGLIPGLAAFMAAVALFQILLGTYNSLWRYAQSREYLRLLAGMFLGWLCYLPVDRLLPGGGVPVLDSVAACALSATLMLLMRFTYRLIRRKGTKPEGGGKSCVAIVGAGAAGVRLLDEILGDARSGYAPWCFIDDSVEKIGKTIGGIEVKGPVSSIPDLLAGTPVREVIVAIASLEGEDRRRIVNLCAGAGVRVKILPDMLTLMREGTDNLTRRIRDVNLDDLLGRTPVQFDGRDVRALLTGKTVLVTGGGGSIGSELCRQIARMEPGRLIIVDNYENSTYEIQQELWQQYGAGLDVRVRIASVREAEKINQIFEEYRPHAVFHAAAHKHVPLMEDCPEEAVKNNILGTYNVVQAADRFRCEYFVLISTDKAVNPTSVMGATKRFCEMIIEGMRNVSATRFVAVRFGNVLGSNGSVIPLFRRQIERGGPVTVTDMRITRYFMTITEAAQLVLQAAALAKSSEIFVLDMGEPIRILDLAESLIRLYGYAPYAQIPIVETGLRPGEKLYEELFMAGEELTDTSNRKIFIEKQTPISRQAVEEKLMILRRALRSGSADAVKDALKTVVPTYCLPEYVHKKTESLSFGPSGDKMAYKQSVSAGGYPGR